MEIISEAAILHAVQTKHPPTKRIRVRADGTRIPTSRRPTSRRYYLRPTSHRGLRNYLSSRSESDRRFITMPSDKLRDYMKNAQDPKIRALMVKITAAKTKHSIKLAVMDDEIAALEAKLSPIICCA
jgi:hypothetical protein